MMNTELPPRMVQAVADATGLLDNDAELALRICGMPEALACVDLLRKVLLTNADDLRAARAALAAFDATQEK